MKVFIVVDTDAGRLSQNMKILSEFGKVFDARSLSEMIQIREREGRIDALFFSTSVPNLKDTVIKIRNQLRNETSKADVYLIGKMDPDSLTDLFQAGVRDITGHPISPIEVGLNKKLPSLYDDERTISVNFGTPQVTREKIILVCSPKGGEGKTTLAVQTGAVMAKVTGKAILIDADYAGNAYRKLGINSMMTHSILEFEKDDSRHLDNLSLEAKLVTHQDSGLKVLCSPWNEYTGIPSKTVENALLAYRRFYANIVVDMHQGYTPALDVLKDYATDVLFVCRPDEDQLERSMETLVRLYDEVPDKLKVIINAVESDNDVQPFRVGFKELKMNATILSLPYAEREFKQRNMLPVFLDPKKSTYSRELRKLLRDIGLSKSGAAKTESSQESQTVQKGSAGIGSFINKLIGRA